MERVIIANGGIVIDSHEHGLEKAAFVIQEDGFDPEIWSKLDGSPSYVHFRYIQECIAQK